MYVPCRMTVLALSANLLLSISAIADQENNNTTILNDPIIVSPSKGAPASSLSPWSKSISSKFRSSARKVIMNLDPPQQFKEIKFQMDPQIKLDFAQIFGSDNKNMKLSYQSPSPITESPAKVIPSYLGPITKVIITYKNPGNHQGVITLLGR